METYTRLAILPLTVESYELEGLEQAVSSEFVRRTTVVRLRGAGEDGLGEDVTYEEAEHLRVQAAGAVEALTGSHTLDSFSARVGHLPNYRRWAFESAALDLALRQAGRSLADALGRTPAPVRFVVSTRARLDEWRSLYPALRFKLDAERDWTDAVVAELAATGVVDVVDLKGHYRGTPVDLAPDPALYRRVAEGFPSAWLEDPWLDDETDAALAPYRDRITWDAPIHSVADVEALPFPPRVLNVKPSRFGSVRALFDTYDYCEERGIGMYGGGQFELGPGRGQIQYLAALFHPDAPNDVAPGAYNGPPAPRLPESPLDPALEPVGFRRRIQA
jgi:hypothetical protein